MRGPAVVVGQVYRFRLSYDRRNYGEQARVVAVSQAIGPRPWCRTTTLVSCITTTATRIEWALTAFRDRLERVVAEPAAEKTPSEVHTVRRRRRCSKCGDETHVVTNCPELG